MQPALNYCCFYAFGKSLFSELEWLLKHNGTNLKHTFPQRPMLFCEHTHNPPSSSPSGHHLQLWWRAHFVRDVQLPPSLKNKNAVAYYEAQLQSGDASEVILKALVICAAFITRAKPLVQLARDGATFNSPDIICSH